MTLQVFPAFHQQPTYKKMEASMKNICLLGFVVALVIGGLGEVNGDGDCGKADPNMEAFKLAPCASAAQDENASVSGGCCAAVKKLGQNPKCLCAVMLSNTAKSSGVKPEIAMTIPKRCNIADRPVGYKCGAYTLP
ncbi:putative lipid-transfer protein DIR1 [Helianthus debilis subsp. tardiflorus]